MNKLRIIAYSPYIGSSEEDGPHMSLGLEAQLRKLTERIQRGYFAQIDGSDVLPVFLAPEWYFCRAGRNYQAGDLSRIVMGLLEFSKLVPKCLIVAGSIAWSLPFSGPPEPPKPKKGGWGLFKKKEPEREMEISGPVDVELNPPNSGMEIIYNTVPIVRDGQIVHFYHKRHEGGEIKDKTRQFGFEVSPIPGFGTMDKFTENTGVFSHEGIRFGVEVCADHKNGALVKELIGLTKSDKDGYQASKPDEKGVDVHMVVACGSGLSTGNIAARVGGAVVVVDGSGKDPHNRKVAVYAGQVASRRAGSLWEGFQSGAGYKLTPDKAKLSNEPDQFRTFVDDTDPDRRIVINKSVYDL